MMTSTRARFVLAMALAAVPAIPAEAEVVESMRAELRLRQWRLPSDATATPMSPEEIERLRALGYAAEPL